MSKQKSPNADERQTMRKAMYAFYLAFSKEKISKLITQLDQQKKQEAEKIESQQQDLTTWQKTKESFDNQLKETKETENKTIEERSKHFEDWQQKLKDWGYDNKVDFDKKDSFSELNAWLKNKKSATEETHLQMQKDFSSWQKTKESFDNQLKETKETENKIIEERTKYFEDWQQKLKGWGYDNKVDFDKKDSFSELSIWLESTKNDYTYDEKLLQALEKIDWQKVNLAAKSKKQDYLVSKTIIDDLEVEASVLTLNANFLQLEELKRAVQELQAGFKQEPARLFLLAQTPRAGKSNHRLIAPPGLPQPLLEQVSEAPEKYGLVIKREVAQHDGRKGEEWLALIGVDIAALSAMQKADVSNKIKILLEKNFANWLQNKTWSKDNQPMVFESDLNTWLSTFKGLQSKAIVYVPESPKEPKSNAGLWWLLSFVIIGLIFAGVWWQQSNKSSSTTRTDNLPTTTTRSQSFCEMANAIGVTMSCPLETRVESQKREALYKLYNGLSKVNAQALQAELTSLQQAAEATFNSRQQEIADWQEAQYALEDIQRKKDELEKEKSRLITEIGSGELTGDKKTEAEKRRDEITKQLKSLENFTNLHATWTATLQAWGYRDTVDFNRNATWQSLTDWLAEQKTDYRQDVALLNKALADGGWSEVDFNKFTQDTDRQVLMAINKILALPRDQLNFASLKNLLAEATK